MKRLLCVAAAAFALSACATQTLYEPATKHTSGNGYSDQRLQTDQWRVTFSGNYITTRQTVENYVLYRAAELTVQNGFDWFETVDRSTEALPTGDYYGGGPYDGWWGGGYGPGWGTSWSYSDGWWDNGVAYQIQNNIIMHHGQAPKGAARAFDAREVLANIGPHVLRPEAQAQRQAQMEAPRVAQGEAQKEAQR
jgi:hypothetical protein